VLLDLFLPDSQGIETFVRLFESAPSVPILILTPAEGEDIAHEAVRRGARDYLFERHLDAYSLSRALSNVMERQAAQTALFLEKERAQVTLDSIGDAVLSTDTLGNVTYLNVVAERMTGWLRHEAVGRPLASVFRIIDGDTREAATNPIERALRLNKTVNLTPNCTLVRRDGLESSIEDSAAPIHNADGEVIGAVIVFHDVSAARAAAMHLEHLAQHDGLTDLANRTLLIDRLTQTIALARRHRSQFAVLFLDLDRFKHVNDSLGHAIGDQLLRSVAARLLAAVRSSDSVSRLGGDEFVIVLSEVDQEEDATLGAQKILTAVTAPHRIVHHDLHVTASIGVSLYPHDGCDPETLITSADTAMYQAKENGRNNYQFFGPEMNVRAAARRVLEGGLRLAARRNEFLLLYQPKVDLQTETIIGAEALIRWPHPTRGLIPPAQFIPVAEDCGLIGSIGQWVLREACRQARAWMDAGLPRVPVAVNISAIEFRDPHFLESLRTILSETRLEPQYLELELTESVLMDNAESSASVLQGIKDMGVQLAIDDFGTGYSSLSYLQQFPIDALKIDRSFVQEITRDSSGTPIVSAVISMGRSLQRRVIAEGVETQEQLAFLRREHCGEGQGFYFSPPVTPKQFAELLTSGIPAEQ
jgi:diguanylate cyclase (GGDEF)-like protein/PAS domain S-box-containing protein